MLADIAEQLSKTRPDLRVVYCTGCAGDAVVPADASGLHKPYRAEQLLIAVAEAT